MASDTKLDKDVCSSGVQTWLLEVRAPPPFPTPWRAGSLLAAVKPCLIHKSQYSFFPSVGPAWKSEYLSMTLWFVSISYSSSKFGPPVACLLSLIVYLFFLFLYKKFWSSLFFILFFPLPFPPLSPSLPPRTPSHTQSPHYCPHPLVPVFFCSIPAPSTLTPHQSHQPALYLWVCFYVSCYFSMFIRFHIWVKTCSICLLSDRLISLSIMFSRSIHTIVKGKISFLFMA